MAVVKADAYGHGAVPVSRAALEAGADSLAVVTVEEGAELRRAGIKAPILVFTDLLPDRLPLAEELRLTVTAHSLASARRVAARPGLEAHLKVNTGMNRWGVEPHQVGEARKILDSQLSGVYTHLASADCVFNGETFFVQGGTVKRVKTWEMAETVEQKDIWEVAALGAALAAKFPH